MPTRPFAPKPARGGAACLAAAAALLLHAAMWGGWRAAQSSGWRVHEGPVAGATVHGPSMAVRWLPEADRQPLTGPLSEALASEPSASASWRGPANEFAAGPAGVAPAVAPGGRRGAVVDYVPAEALSDRPRPEPGWVLDEDALASVRQARLTMRVWVSAQGRIDRVALLSAEPPGEWAERTLQRLPDTAMSPGFKDGHAVPSTLVVEIASENESFR